MLEENQDLVADLRDLASVIDEVQGKAVFGMTSGALLHEAATTIENLRKALIPILDTYHKPGIFPGYHSHLKNKLNKDWPELARAIQDAIFASNYEDEGISRE